jgi:hypothetical protein
MVTDGLVVEVKVLRELVGVPGALIERLEDTDTVLTAPGSGQHVPEDSLHRQVVKGPDDVRPPTRLVVDG